MKVTISKAILFIFLLLAFGCQDPISNSPTLPPDIPRTNTPTSTATFTDTPTPTFTDTPTATSTQTLTLIPLPTWTLTNPVDLQPQPTILPQFEVVCNNLKSTPKSISADCFIQNTGQCIIDNLLIIFYASQDDKYSANDLPIQPWVITNLAIGASTSPTTIKLENATQNVKNWNIVHNP
jgi:hypothetical protein